MSTAILVINWSKKSNEDVRDDSESMGTSHSVYMANSSGQNISILVGLNPKWALLDFFLDITLVTIGANDIRALALSAADLGNYKVPGKLETLQDLFDYSLAAGYLIVTGSSRPTVQLATAQRFVDSVKKTAVSISRSEYKLINQRNVLEIYLNPSGYAGILGAKTVTVYVMSADGKQTALYNTGPDNSWIATGSKTIVRSKYGTIWQQDPGAGSHAWPISTATRLMASAMVEADGKEDVVGGVDEAGGKEDVVDAVDEVDGKDDAAGAVDSGVGTADGADSAEANAMDSAVGGA